MLEWTERQEIEAPVGLVWRVVADVESWPEWTPTIVRIARLAGSGLEHGASFRIRQPSLPAATWRVVGVDPGRSFRWQSRTPGVLVEADHRLAPVGDRTEVELAIRFGGVLGRASGYMLRRLTRRLLRLEAQGLKSRCEWLWKSRGA
ncbi:MAG: SRPBCC family protein [Proteobacteria bacterium]|nr:SRPBCC family protein [Pseudomonadota bacterium]